MENKNEVVVRTGQLPVQSQPATIQESGPVGALLKLQQAGIPIDSIDKILDAQERHDMMIAKKEFTAAMVKTQRDMPVIFEGRTNKGANDSKYAAYKDIVRYAKPIYTKHGLSVSFYEEDSPKDDYIRWCADVYHKAGYSRPFHTDLPIDDKGPKGSPVKTKIHGTKSSMSYGRGILLCSIFNIPTSDDVDDDGNGAGAEIKYVTEKQANQIADLLAAIDMDESKFLDHYAINSIPEMTVRVYKKAKPILDGRYKELKKNGGSK